MAQIEVKGLNVELSGFGMDQELRWGLLQGLSTSLEPQSHTNISEQWGADSQKTNWAAWKPQNELFCLSPTFPSCLWENPQSAACFRAHVYLWFPSLIISFTKASPCSRLQQPGFAGRGQNPGWISLQVQIPEEFQCPDFCRAFDNGKKKLFSKPLWSPLSCSWDFSSSFSFLIKYCFRSWYSGMALEDERKIFISFFCLWIRMFYLKKVPSAGLLMSYYPLWK